MKEFHNEVKVRLKNGEKTAGAWAQTMSNMSAEILARADFDWVIVDMEHAPNDFSTLLTQVQAIRAGNAECTPFVRAPWNDPVTIKKILDCGVYGVLVPQVSSAEEAEAAVRACKYPPLGIRGLAGSPRAAHFGYDSMPYLSHANDEISVMIAVETPEAVACIDEIVKVEGLDGIFIGPMDLATSMGHFCEPSHPEVKEAIAKIEKAVLGSGKYLGTVAAKWETAQALYAKGYQFLMLMADGGTLSRTANECVQRFQKEIRQEAN